MPPKTKDFVDKLKGLNARRIWIVVDTIDQSRAVATIQDFSEDGEIQRLVVRPA